MCEWSEKNSKKKEIVFKQKIVAKLIQPVLWLICKNLKRSLQCT